MKFTELKNILKEIGVKVSPMKYVEHRGVFLIQNNSKRDGIQVKIPDGLDLKVKANKRLRQAVINVTEPAREFEEDAFDYFFVEEEFKNIEEFKKIRDFDYIFQSLIDECTKVQDAEHEIVSIDPSFSECLDGGFDVGIFCRIKIKAPAQTNSFLVGFDEEHTFICQLKEVANSVKQAHDLLRPEGISKDAIRVGEYFFDPADIEVEYEYVRYGEIYTEEEIETEYGPEKQDVFSDNHYANIYRDYDATYVSGPVSDLRGHHKTIFLDKWYKVVRNNEVINQNDTAWD